MKKVLFLCVENSCRSQMAEGFTRTLAAGTIKAYSAGSHPAGEVNQQAIEVMRQEGIDISAQTSKGVNALLLRDFDFAVSLGCEDTCPFVPAEKHIRWQIDDPKGRDLTFFKKVRDDIKYQVEQLIHKAAIEDWT